MCRPLQGIWLHKQRADGENIYGLRSPRPKKTKNVAAKMMPYKNKRIKLSSPDSDTDYFDIVAGVLQGYVLAIYLFIICFDYMLRTSIDLMKGDGFTLAKARSRRYPAHTIMDVDYADNIALFVNTPAKAESILHRLERADGWIGLNVNPDKTEYMSSNQSGDIFTLKKGSLKLVDYFTFHGSSVSLNENKINAWLANAWTAIDRLSIIWKLDLSNKIKRIFIQVAVVSIRLYRCTTWTLP